MPVNLPRSFVFKVTQLCNIDCSYCYVYHHEDESFKSLPKFIDNTSIDLLGKDLQYIFEQSDYPDVTIVFHGGEPLMLGKRRFRAVMQRLRKFSDRIKFAVQSNALLLDEEWIKLLKDEQVNLSLSIDGYQETHDRYRVDKRNRGTYERICEKVDLLHHHELPFGVLCVVDPLADGARAYDTLSSLKPRQISFLLPDVSHESKKEFYPVVVDGDLSTFLMNAFDRWFYDTKRVHVRLFQDLVMGHLGNPSTTDIFGSANLGYLIYETDGSYEILDVLKVCAEDITSIDKSSRLPEIMKNRRLTDLVANQKNIPTNCKPCRFAEQCRGGYLPHRYSRQNGFDNPSAWCADLYRSWEHVEQRLASVLDAPTADLAAELKESMSAA